MLYDYTLNFTNCQGSRFLFFGSLDKLSKSRYNDYVLYVMHAQHGALAGIFGGSRNRYRGSSRDGFFVGLRPAEACFLRSFPPPVTPECERKSSERV